MNFLTKDAAAYTIENTETISSLFFKLRTPDSEQQALLRKG